MFSKKSDIMNELFSTWFKTFSKFLPFDKQKFNLEYLEFCMCNCIHRLFEKVSYTGSRTNYKYKN